MGRFRFPTAARIGQERDFRRAYREGRRYQAFPLRLCALRRPDAKACRLGLSVSRKVGDAVLRNRWKRAVREAFRLNRHRLCLSYDLIVSISWEARPEDVRRVEASFRDLVCGLNSAKAGQLPAAPREQP
jgi:ribonuclease P protein component